MSKVCCVFCVLLIVSIQSCTRNKRIEIKNSSSYNSLLTIVKANGKEVFKGDVARARGNSYSKVTSFRYRGDSCTIQVDIPELKLIERKNFIDLEHEYIVITIRQIAAGNTQVLIDAPQTVALGAAD